MDKIKLDSKMRNHGLKYILKDGSKAVSVTTVIGNNLGWNKNVLIGWTKKQTLMGINTQEVLRDAGDIVTLAHFMVEKYEEVYGIDPDTDDSIWVGGLIGTESVAYFARCIRAILPTLLTGEDVTIVTKFNKTKSFQFESNRKRIANELRSYILNSARAIVNAVDSAKGFGKINYCFIKQLPTDPTFTEINSNEK